MPTLELICGQGSNQCAFVEKTDSNYTKDSACTHQLKVGKQPGGTGGQTVSRRSWWFFNLSSLPADANVTKVELKYKVTGAGGAAGVWKIWSYGGTSGNKHPCDDTPMTCFASCAYGGGALYLNTTNPRAVGTYTEDLGIDACGDVEYCRDGDDKYAVSMSEDGDDDAECTIEGCQSGTTYAPRLVITYEVPAVAGYGYGDGLVSVQVAG